MFCPLFWPRKNLCHGMARSPSGVSPFGVQGSIDSPWGMPLIACQPVGAAGARQAISDLCSQQRDDEAPTSSAQKKARHRASKKARIAGSEAHPDNSLEGRFVKGPWRSNPLVEPALIRERNSEEVLDAHADDLHTNVQVWTTVASRMHKLFPEDKRKTEAYKDRYASMEKAVRIYMAEKAKLKRKVDSIRSGGSGEERDDLLRELEGLKVPDFLDVFVETGAFGRPFTNPPATMNSRGLTSFNQELKDNQHTSWAALEFHKGNSSSLTS